MNGITIAQLSNGAVSLMASGKLGHNPTAMSKKFLVSVVSNGVGYASITAMNGHRPDCITWLESESTSPGMATFGLPNNFAPGGSTLQLCRQTSIQKLVDGNLRLVGEDGSESSGRVRQVLALEPISWPVSLVNRLEVESVKLGPVSMSGLQKQGDFGPNDYCNQCSASLARYTKQVGIRPGSGYPATAALVVGQSLLGGYDGPAVQSFSGSKSFGKEHIPLQDFDAQLIEKFGAPTLNTRGHQINQFRNSLVFAYNKAGQLLSMGEVAEQCNPFGNDGLLYNYQPNSDLNLWGCGAVLRITRKIIPKAGVEYVAGYDYTASYPASLLHHHLTRRIEHVLTWREAFLSR